MKNIEWVWGQHDFVRNIALVCLEWVSKEIGLPGEVKEMGEGEGERLSA